MNGVGLAGERILIVEDEAIIAMLLEDLIEDLGGVPVGPAADVEQALANLASEEIDAAVLDVNLRGERTYALADALAARELPFLFITGYGRSGLDAAYQDRPVLQKPFTRDVLAEALHSLLR